MQAVQCERLLEHKAISAATTPKFRTPDSLHLATAILADADVFVSGDGGIDVPVPMLKYRL